MLICAASCLQIAVLAALLRPAVTKIHVGDGDNDSSNDKDIVKPLRRDEAKMSADELSLCGEEAKVSSPCIETDVQSTPTPTRSKCDLRLFRNPKFWLFLLAGSFSMATFSAYLNGITDCAYRNGIPLDRAVFVASVIGITGLVSQGILALLGDRLSAVPVLMIGTFSLAVAYFVIIAVTDSYLVYIISSALEGGGAGLIIAATPVVLTKVFGIDQLARALGYSKFFKGVISLMAPPLQGSLYDLTGSYTPAWIIYTLVALISTITIGFMWWILRRTKQLDTIEE